jgi:spectrin alpha
VLSLNFGNSLPSVQNLIKKHAALLAEIASRERAVRAVEEAADAMVAAQHYALDALKDRKRMLLERWTALNAAATQRNTTLTEALAAQQYYADASEAEAWLTEKEPIVASDDLGKDEDGALALLKKHEAVESDIATFQSTITTLHEQSARCKDVVPPPGGSTGAPVSGVSPSGRHTPSRYSLSAHGSLMTISPQSNGRASVSQLELSPPPPQFSPGETEDPTTPVAGKDAPAANNASSDTLVGCIAARQTSVDAQYASLRARAQVRHTSLTEAQRLFQLFREMDEVDAWIADREAFAAQTELGSDLEHNLVVQKKFDEFAKDLGANETRVASVAALGQRLVGDGHSQAPAIEKRLAALAARWANLQEMATGRSARLLAARAAHQFTRDSDETKARLAERDVVLSSDDYGKDIATVEALQRRHDGILRDLAALDGKVKELEGNAGELQTTHPAHADSVQTTLGDVQQQWTRLRAKADARKQRLDEARDYQQFVSDHRDLASWIQRVQVFYALFFFFFFFF